MKVLIVSARFPYPPLKGDQALVYYRAREIAQHCDVSLISYATPHDTQHLGALQGIFRHIWTLPLRYPLNLLENLPRLLFTPIPLQVGLFASRHFGNTLKTIAAQGFDVIDVVTQRMAWSAKGVRLPKVLDCIDSMKVNMERRAGEEKNLLVRFIARLEARRLGSWEAKTQAAYDACVFVSRHEAEHAQGAKIVTIPLGVDVDAFAPGVPASDSPTIVFSGNMGYFPNINAITWFVQHCFPLIRAAEPRVQLRVVGTRPAASVVRLHDGKAIVVTGPVESITSELQRAQVAIAPMRAGSGMQFKILEAMACGIPVVATRLGLGAIDATPEEHLLVADQPQEFAGAVLRLLSDRELRTRIGRNARELICAKYSWKAHAAHILSLYKAVGGEAP